MSYGLMWADADSAAIEAELDAFERAGHDVENSRLMSFLSDLAGEGARAKSRNVHMHVGSRTLHSACPFGIVGVFYAYDGPPTKDIYILGFCTDVFKYVATAASRLTNVP